MKNELYPNQIVQAIRLTKPAFQKQYQYIPRLLGFFKIDDRLCLKVDSQKYSLRYMLA